MVRLSYGTHPALGDAVTEPTRAQALAREHLVLLTRVGSTVHGCGVDGQDDEDQLGVCVEPPRTTLGLERFEHFEWRSQPTGARSGPGDLDLTVYALRKWTKLAVDGNPSILVPLFVPATDVIYASSLGVNLRLQASLFVSRRAGRRFLGYLRSQRDRLTGRRGGMTKRPELVERYGFDTKFAYHMIRLGFQGVELLATGRLALPMPVEEARWLRALRVGERTLDEALELAGELEAELVHRILRESPLPDDPDLDAVNDFLTNAHLDHWEERGLL